MFVDRLVGKALELNVSVEAAAVLAARLHLIATGEAGDPVITRQLDHVLELAGLASLVASVTASEAAMVAGMLRRTCCKPPS